MTKPRGQRVPGGIVHNLTAAQAPRAHRQVAATPDQELLDPREADRIAAELVARGVIRGPVELLRRGSNHVFRAGPLVLRISRADRDVPAQIRLADRLARHGVPILQPVDDLGPIGAGHATLWEYVEPGPGGVDYTALGRAISRLHAIPPHELDGVVALPPFQQAGWLALETNLNRAAATGLLADEELAALSQAVDDLRGWERLDPDQPTTVCHGDVHPANVLMRRGEPLIIDWDLICLGPPAWDHAAMITWPARWGGHPGDYSNFASGYGTDLSSDPLAQQLARVRLIGPTINMVIRGAESEQDLAEARARLRYWLGDPDAPPWTPQ